MSNKISKKIKGRSPLKKINSHELRLIRRTNKASGVINNTPKNAKLIPFCLFVKLRISYGYDEL